MDGERAAAIEVIGLRAGYGQTLVVNGVDLAVAPGEFVAILGSSGCGKTTLLRTIAGFQKAFAGRVRSFGRDMTDLPPEQRDVAMVFQSYALWPHMTVLGNIGYTGARLRRDQIKGGREHSLDAEHGGSRRPQSHGPVRRTAAAGGARPHWPSSHAVPLDEPPSNRPRCACNCAADQGAKAGSIASHVTHDREEAMTMADASWYGPGHIARSAPEDVYHRPNSPFVATFMGADNTIELKIGDGPAGAKVEAGPHHEPTPLPKATAAGPVLAYFRDDVARIERPEHRADGKIALQGKVMLRSYPGRHYRYAIAVGDREYMVRDARLFEVGTAVGVCLPIGALHLFPVNENSKPN